MVVPGYAHRVLPIRSWAASRPGRSQMTAETDQWDQHGSTGWVEGPSSTDVDVMASLYELLMSLSLRDEAAASPESSELGSDCVMENAGAETAIPVRHDIEEHDEVIDVARTPPSLLELKTATLHRSPACDFRWHPASLDRYGPELPRVLSNRLTTVLSSPAQFALLLEKLPVDMQQFLYRFVWRISQRNGQFALGPEDVRILKRLARLNRRRRALITYSRT